MNNLVLVIIEIVSAALAFILVRFMIKPYVMTGENRYLGLPFGFTFLGVSFIFLAASLFPSNPSTIDRIKWLQLFTASYAFAFLSVTYYFSSKTFEHEARLFMQAFISFLFLLLVFLFIILFLPPIFTIPSYKRADEYFRLFNIILALYITFHTLRNHALKPEPKTILAPLGYALLAFSQYSLLIWSLDSSFSAFIGAHITRIASLLVFLSISYKAIIAPQNAIRETVVQK